METWKPIPKYEGRYEASDLGRIRSLVTNRVLSQGKTGRYNNVVLCDGFGGKRTMSVHRIIAKLFCENRGGKTEVNHINEDTHNNRAENLEWCTRVENIRHGTGIQRHADAQRNKHGSKRMLQMTVSGEIVREFPSLKEAKRNGFDPAFIARCAKGKHETAYGFKWRYATEYSDREAAL